jgi:Transposase DDE domain
MDAFNKKVLSRLPLAEAAMRCWQWVCGGEFLQQVFERFRGRSYEDTLTFEMIVRLVADALIEHRGSGNQAFQRAAENEELETTTRAVYGKLRRIPIALSDGFLWSCTQRLLELWPRRTPGSLPVPGSLRKFEVLFVDGKKIKRVPRRNKVARKVTVAVLGAKTISALSWQQGLVIAMHADPDGEKSDAPLVPGLLDQLNTLDAGPRLFVADRQFCDLVQPHQLTARQGDHFLIRYCHKVHFERDETVPVWTGTDPRGNPFVEDWGWIGKTKDRRRLRVRRITLHRLPTPDDPAPEPIILLTDLLEADAYPAIDLLEAYRARWGIEQVFQKITEVYHLDNLISTSPEGTAFQCAFCLLLYNILQLLAEYLAVEEKIPATRISLENLFSDVQRQLTAWNELVPSEMTLTLAGLSTVSELRERLKFLLSEAWTNRWLKAPPKKKRSQLRLASQPIPGTHTSMFRLLHSPPAQKKPTKRKKPPTP